MENVISVSVYGILNGAVFNLCFFSFFFAYSARTLVERIGFIFCTLSLAALFVFTMVHLRLSFFVVFCWLVGFGIAANTIKKQTDQLDSPQNLRIERMRKASRSSRAISNMVLSLQILLLPAIFGLPRDGLSFFFGTFFVFIVASVVSLIAGFLERPSRLASFVSGLGGNILALLTSIPLSNLLMGRPGLGTTFAIALCFSCAILLGFHAVAVGALTPHEIVLVNPPGQRSIFSLKHSRMRPGVPLLKGALSWCFDVLGRLISGLSVFCKLFLLGSIAFTVGYFPWAIPWKDLSWENLLALLGALDLRILVAIVGAHTALALLAILLSGFSFLLRKLSNFLSEADHELAVSKDDRPQILFLRAFSNDQAVLPRPALFRRLWEGRLEIPALDHQLIDEFGLLAPVVAFGPGGKPYGASRRTVRSADWIDYVADDARQALAVVIVCVETESVSLEISRLQAEGLTRKVLFLADPETPMRGLEKHPQVRWMLPDAPADSIVAGFYQVGDCASRTLTCKRLEAEDYIVCCNAFFTELLEPDSLSRAFARLVPVEVD